ncbi:MAG: sortase [Candidatus Beckwithbacteria bacterium]|nr:sortase [Patescibacteria group bacterium]
MNRKKIIVWSINLGLVLAVGGLVWIFGPSLFMEIQFKEMSKQRGEGEASKSGFSSLMYSMSGVEEPMKINMGLVSDEASLVVLSGFGVLVGEEVLIAPISSEFGLVIPKIFANVAVTKNVNPADEKEYQEVLRQAGGVAHSSGTSVPGELGTTYIFGHSTDASINVERFNAVFYLLNKLEPGDLIVAYYKGKQYKYEVSDKKVVDPTDLSEIVRVDNEERLVLQTCWPPGTDWRRLLVVAKPREV